jgi:hypothetical protein
MAVSQVLADPHLTEAVDRQHRVLGVVERGNEPAIVDGLEGSAHLDDILGRAVGKLVLSEAQAYVVCLPIDRDRHRRRAHHRGRGDGLGVGSVGHARSPVVSGQGDLLPGFMVLRHLLHHLGLQWFECRTSER